MDLPFSGFTRLWWPLLRLTLKDSMFILYDGFAGALGSEACAESHFATSAAGRPAHF